MKKNYELKTLGRLVLYVVALCTISVLLIKISPVLGVPYIWWCQHIACSLTIGTLCFSLFSLFLMALYNYIYSPGNDPDQRWIMWYIIAVFTLLLSLLAAIVYYAVLLGISCLISTAAGIGLYFLVGVKLMDKVILR